MSNNLKLTDNEKRDIIKYLESGKPLPEKYRFLLFDSNREVELLWNGKTDEVENTVLPFQTIEQIDEPRSEEKITDQASLFDTSGRQMKGWSNKLIWGDNKLILSSLNNGPLRKQIEAEGGIKLIYIDPPFSAGLDYTIGVSIGDGESIQKSPSIIEEFAYRNTWGKGGNTFLSMLYERVKMMKDLLADDGILFFRIDWHWGHYTKIMLDEIFNKENFQSEIVINRIKKNITEQGKVSLPTANDSLFVYFKSKASFRHIDKELENERPGYWRAADDSSGERRPRERVIEGKTFYPPAGKHFKFSKDNLQKMYENKLIRINPNNPDKLQYWVKAKSSQTMDTNWTDVAGYAFKTGYPTENAEPLLERIIDITTKEGDLVADFFNGSGTTIAVAEKMGRKWIGTDIGKFSIHTTRKRMIEVQRELKKDGKDYRAFEILNIGRYARETFLNVNENLREEEKRLQREQKEKDFIRLILSAYKAEPVDSFNNFVGKKRDRLVAIGQIDKPITSSFLEKLVLECKEKGITKADVLGFDWEMGVDFEDPKKQGLDIQFKIIPREVFDKKAVEKGQVKFHEVAYIEVKPIIRGRGNIKEVAIELTDFSVFYNQDNTGEVEEKLKSGQSKIVIENGQVVKFTKDKESELIEKEILTKKWTDWIDYWSVDFDYESKKEIVRTNDEEEKEEWTGNYIFENEWQSFRTKKDRSLELTSVYKEMPKGRIKIAIKVIDIFGNDTTKVIEINI
ncbi:site-specific DNA-methyltransferase [Candidatus Gracilibacteria bacterium]|nr:site-specific DNA-methyltransferase [Candidatus Gracilibacteria bacterium]